MMGRFFQNTRFLALTLCLITVWGLFSLYHLPRLEDPQISQRWALVTTDFPGASAERVETLVTQKLEDTLFEIDEVDHLMSRSQQSRSSIIIRLKPDVNNTSEVFSKVRDRLSDVAAQLPVGVLDPQYRDLSSSAYTLIVALTWNDNTPVDYSILNRLGKTLEDIIRTEEGTLDVDPFGFPDEEIAVAIDPQALADLGLTPQALAHQIQDSDAKVGAGQLRTQANNLAIEMDTELDSLERIRRIPIRYGSEQFTRLSDIASVRSAFHEPSWDVALVSGHHSVVVAARAEAEQRVEQWVEQVQLVLKQFQMKLPTGIQLEIVHDHSRYINARLENLWNNMLLGGACVLVSTGLLIGWESAIVIGASLPLTILLVLGVMGLMGIPLHQISVTGFIIALGILVDTAIVVIDQVQSKCRAGMGIEEAIANTIRLYTIPLLSSTLTTVITFSPILLLNGDVGEFVGTLAWSVNLCLIASFFLSLTIIPAFLKILRSGFQPPSPTEPSSPARAASRWWHSGLSFPFLTRRYRLVLGHLFANPKMTVLLALFLPMTGLLLVPSLHVQLFPPADRDQFYIEFEFPPTTTINQIESTTLQARELIRQYPTVEKVHWFIGRNAPSIYYNMERWRLDQPNYAQAIVQLQSAQGVPELIRTLQSQLNETFPNIQSVVKQLEQGSIFFAPLELRIYGSNPDILRDLGQQVRSIMMEVPNIIHTRTSLGITQPQLALELDEELALRSGLSPSRIAEQLDASLEGYTGGSILDAGEEIRVRVRLDSAERAKLSQIQSLNFIPSPDGTGQHPGVPLSALASFSVTPEFSVLERRDGLRLNTVQGFTSAGILPSTLQNDFVQRLEVSGFSLPGGYSIEMGGEQEVRREAILNLASNLHYVLVCVTVVLVISFNSFGAASLIGLVGLCSIGFGFLALEITNQPLGFMALLGITALTGAAINDSIVVLEALRADLRMKPGDRRAIVEVVIHETRHVITTTVTTVTGFIPLLISGNPLWLPISICMTVGVLGGTYIAVTLVPCLYLIFEIPSRSAES